MKRLFLFAILLGLEWNTGYSQGQVTGAVRDAEAAMPLVRASVSLHAVKSQKLLSYAFTNSEGHFNLNLPKNALSDSLILKVKYLGYASFFKVLSLKSQHLAIRLALSDTPLKEVKIKAQALLQVNDTLSYRVSEFKNANDQVLSDVLKKLPGVTLNKDGKIYYEGKAINRFYIDGLNLLDGKYNLASNNLAIDIVSQIEVLENHQPVRALKDLQFSERAAINIKLKNDVAFTANAVAGVTHNLKYAAINISPMLFAKKSQFLNTSQFNSTGKDIGKDLRSFDLLEEFNSKKLSNSKQDLLSASRVAMPNLSDERLRFNKSFLESINYLRKLKNDFQMKGNFGFLSDKVDFLSQNTINYFLTGNEGKVLRSSQELQNRLTNYDGSVTLSKNVARFFLKEQFDFSYSSGGSDGGSMLDDSLTSNADLSHVYSKLKNTFQLLFPLKANQKLQLFSNTIFSKNRQKLLVQPIPLFFEQGNEGLLQNYENPQFLTINALSHFFYKNKLTLESKLSFVLERQKLNTGLSFLKGSLSFDDAYKNRLRWKKENVEFLSSWKIRYEKYFLRANVGLNLYQFHLAEKAKNFQYNLEKVTLEPSVFFQSKFRSKVNFNMNLAIKNRFGGILDVYPGYVLRSTALLSKRNGGLNVSKNYLGSAAVFYKDIVNFLMINSLWSYDVNRNELLQGTRFLQDGSMESYFIKENNSSSSRRWVTNLSKYFNTPKINFKYSSSLFTNQYAQLLGNEKRISKSSVYTTKVSLARDINQKVSLSSIIEMKKTKEHLKESDLGFNLTTFSHELKSSYLFCEKVNVENTLNYSRNRGAGVKNSYLFSDLNLSYSMPKKRLKVRLAWSNIFNSKQYIMVRTSPGFQTISSIPFRSSQALVSLNFGL